MINCLNSSWTKAVEAYLLFFFLRLSSHEKYDLSRQIEYSFPGDVFQFYYILVPPRPNLDPLAADSVRFFRWRAWQVACADRRGEWDCQRGADGHSLMPLSLFQKLVSPLVAGTKNLSTDHSFETKVGVQASCQPMTEPVDHKISLCRYCFVSTFSS